MNRGTGFQKLKKKSTHKVALPFNRAHNSKVGV
jgi:hypothetical protein